MLKMLPKLFVRAELSDSYEGSIKSVALSFIGHRKHTNVLAFTVRLRYQGPLTTA